MSVLSNRIQERLGALGREFYARSQSDGGDSFELATSISEEGFEQVGAGGGRRVFTLPPEYAAEFQERMASPSEAFVVKFALYAARDCIDGRTQNRREMELSESAPPLVEERLLRTVGGGEDGFWVVQPYAESVEETTPEFHEVVGPFIAAGYRDELARRNNWGRIGGRLRLIDFGYID